MLVGVGDCVEADDSGGGQRECPLIVLHVRLYLAVFVVSVKLFWRGVWREMELPFGRKSPRIWGSMRARKGFGKLFFDFFFKGKGIFLGWGWENGDFGVGLAGFSGV